MKLYYITTLYEGEDNESFASNAHYVQITSTEDDPILPLTTALKGNYPNPFNPETTIQFDLSVESMLRIDIFNIKGQRVTTLVNELYKPGEHTIVWKGTDSNGRQVASGVYFYRMTTDEYSAVKRMMLVR